MPEFVPFPKFVKSSAVGSYLYVEPHPLKLWFIGVLCCHVERCWGQQPFINPETHFTDKFFSCNSKFSSNTPCNDAFATSFCKCHDSTAVEVCAKICSDVMVRNWIIRTCYFSHIWNVVSYHSWNGPSLWKPVDRCVCSVQMAAPSVYKWPPLAERKGGTVISVNRINITNHLCRIFQNVYDLILSIFTWFIHTHVKCHPN